MRGLLLRLSALDADAENAVRVIGFFDRLITERAGLDTLVRTTAELAGCPVGLHAPGQGLSLRADAGAVTTGRVPAKATTRALEGGVEVWVAREGKPAPLDDMLLERFAIAAAVLLEHSSVPLPELGDPALVELVLSEGVGTAERSRALHLLGIGVTAPLRVLAATGEVAGRSVVLGDVRAVLATQDALPDPAGGRLGVGPEVPAIDAAKSWQAARTALRYTSDGEPVVWWEKLGSLAVLAERLDDADLAALPDVQALDHADADLITALEALCATGSVRQAAAALHRHHSTMTARLARAESMLGFELDSASGRFRLHLALMLRRLRDNGR